MPSDAVSIGPKQRGAPFAKGTSGNPAGRPPGSRHRISDALLQIMADDFEAHGEAAIVRVRQEDPAAYLKVVASLVPKQIGVDVTLSGIAEQLARARQRAELKTAQADREKRSRGDPAQSGNAEADGASIG